MARLTVRTGGGTSISVVSKLMNVHSTLSGGITALDIVGDSCRRRLGRLLEGHGTTDILITAEHSNCELICQLDLSIGGASQKVAMLEMRPSIET